MQELDPTQYKESPSISGDISVQPAPKELDPSKFKELDSSAFKELPSYADGASPDTPLNSSPISPMDRMKLSLGNESGNISYLKQRFDDVRKNADGDLVIKDGDTYHRVDEKSFSEPDAWSTTRSIIKKLPGATGAVLDGLAGSAGLAVGGPAGLAAGAAVGDSIRTSLGRLVGTYEATPQQQIADNSIEGLLQLGGHKILAGVKPTVSDIASAVTKFVDDSAPAVRQTIAKVLSTVSQTSYENMNRVLGPRVSDVMGALESATKNAGDEGVESALKVANINKVKGVLTGAQKALSSQFDSKESDLLASVPKSVKVNVGETVSGAFNYLVSMGAVVPKQMSQNGDKVIQYKLANEQALMDFLKHPEGSGALSIQAVNSLKQFVEMGNKFLNVGVKEGEEGVQSLINIRRGFDKFYMSTVKANPDAKQVLTPISQAVRSNIVENIGKVSPEVAQKYTAMNSFYSEKIPYVAAAERTMNNLKAPETLVQQLTSGDGKNETAKQIVKTVAELKGDTGQKLYESLKDGIAANDFVRISPALTLKSGITAAIGGKLLGPAALAAAPFTSPRGVAMMSQFARDESSRGASQGASQLLPYANKFLDFVKSSTPDQISQLIKSPELFNSLIRTTISGPQQSQQVKSQLLNSAGIKSE